jgi:hypothetical protein
MTRIGLIVLMVFTLIGSGYSEDAITISKNTLKTQIELMKKGDLENLKACFTERVRDVITLESMKSGLEGVTKYTLDDLVSKVVEGDYNGNRTIKIKMKNGRTLTTLVLIDGKWFSDRVWFK